MPRSRNLKPGFFKNEDLVALGYEAMLCFAGLWTLADREGRLEDRPRRIKVELFPYTDVNIDGLLKSLEDAGFIRRYSVDESSTGHRQAKHDFILVCAWAKHQNPHHKEIASIIPPPPPTPKPKQPHEIRVDKPTTIQVRPMVEPSMDQGNRVLPSDSLSSDSLSLDSGGLSPLPLSQAESPPAPRTTELTRADQISATEPGDFDVQIGWREFSARYPNKTGVDAACRWYVSEMARREPPEQIELHTEIMVGLNRHLKCGQWRHRKTGELELRYIVSMDKFLGVPKDGDPSRGKVYPDHPAEWQPPANREKRRDSGSHLRDQLRGNST